MVEGVAKAKHSEGRWEVGNWVRKFGSKCDVLQRKREVGDWEVEICA